MCCLLFIFYVFWWGFLCLFFAFRWVGLVWGGIYFIYFLCSKEVPVLLAFYTRRVAIQERRIVEEIVSCFHKKKGMENGGRWHTGRGKVSLPCKSLVLYISSEESWALGWGFISLCVVYGRIYSLRHGIRTMFLYCPNNQQIPYIARYRGNFLHPSHVWQSNSLRLIIDFL